MKTEPPTEDVTFALHPRFGGFAPGYGFYYIVEGIPVFPLKGVPLAIGESIEWIPVVEWFEIHHKNHRGSLREPGEEG